MHLNQKLKLLDFYMKMDPPMWIDADFECMNIRVDNNQIVSNADSTSHAGSANKELFVNKPVAMG